MPKEFCCPPKKGRVTADSRHNPWLETAQRGKGPNDGPDALMFTTPD
jgi:hypothetical protein